MKTFCIITARGGSKGLPGKNIKLFAGKPLISYTITSALKSKLISKVHVSSDCDNILKISEQFGAIALKRPSELATDQATSDSVVSHHLSEALKEDQYDCILLLQPTSPLRTTKNIDEVLEQFKKKKEGSIFSVTKLKVSPYRSYTIENDILTPLFEKSSATRRQDEAPTYAANGAIYVFSVSAFLLENRIPKTNITPYIMSEENSIDIDNHLDFRYAEFIYKESNKGFKK